MSLFGPFLVTACTVKEAEPLSTDTVLSDWRLGPVRIGMSVDEIQQAAGPLDGDGITQFPEDQQCYFVWPRNGPEGVSFMIVEGTLARIEVQNAAMKTSRGAKIGDSEVTIMEIYDNDVTVQARPYVGEPDHYLIVDSLGDVYSTLFQTHNGKVEDFRAGRYDAVRWIEGCL